MSGSILPKLVNDGLIMFVDAGNISSYIGTGSTWLDLYRYGTNLTMSGPFVYDSTGTTLTFNGSSTYAYSSSFYPIEGPATMCMLCRPTSTGNRTFFSVSNASGTGGGFQAIQFGYSSGLPNVLRVWRYGGVPFSEIGSLPINNWHYICVSYSSSVLNAYINGILVNSVPNPNLQTGLGRLLIGTYRHLPSPLEVFAGQSGICQYYNRILSDSEILQNYNFFKNRFGL